MVKIVDLTPGDEVLGFMKNGFALRKALNSVTGLLYRFAPSRPDTYDQDDLAKFTGLVTANDPVNQIITIEVQEVNRFTMSSSPSIRADIPYKALARLRRLSKVNYPGKPQNPLRPTQVARGSENRPYRTVEEVLLRWN